MFLNWWNHICVLVNLTKDEIEQTNGNSEIEDFFFYNRMTEINTYLTDRLLIGDIMIPYVKKVENTYSYKLVYKPFLSVLSKWWVVRNIIFYSSVITIAILCL